MLTIQEIFVTSLFNIWMLKDHSGDINLFNSWMLKNHSEDDIYRVEWPLVERPYTILEA